MADKVVTRDEQIQDQQRAAAREAVEHADDKPMTETVSGGRYLLDDGETVVDANGKPIKK